MAAKKTQKSAAPKKLMVPFKCPRCGAPPHKHGKGGSENCKYGGTGKECEGLICECDPQDYPASEKADHGMCHDNACPEANCYHCGFGGTVPEMPKKMPAWTKEALKAGWVPPKGWKPS